MAKLKRVKPKQVVEAAFVELTHDKRAPPPTLDRLAVQARSSLPSRGPLRDGGERMSGNRTLSSVAMTLLLVSVGVGCGSSSAPSPATPTPVTATAAPAQSITMHGTVVNETGAPVAAGMVTFEMGFNQPKTVIDATGHYQIDIPAGQYFIGRAETDGYESSFRGAYFEAGPDVLNFRVFRTLRVTAGDSAHVAITSDGSICGFDDEWLCRTVHVSSTNAGILRLSVVGDDPSMLASVTTNQHYYPLNAALPVVAGQDVDVQVLLPWSGPGGGVTLLTSVQ